MQRGESEFRMMLTLIAAPSSLKETQTQKEPLAQKQHDMALACEARRSRVSATRRDAHLRFSQGDVE